MTDLYAPRFDDPRRINDPIEQARARGWTAERTAAYYGRTFEFVIRIWEAMDDAAGVVDRLTDEERVALGKLAPHGTLGAYRRHLRLGEQACTPCRKANRDAARKRAARLQPCGTVAAYQRHLNHGEDACDDCKAANAAAYQARKEATA